jgi:hypothetical protein
LLLEKLVTRGVGLIRLRMGHSDVFSVRDLFQSDTVTRFMSESLELLDSE